MTHANGGLGHATNTPGAFGRLLSRLRGSPVEYDLGAYLSALDRVKEIQVTLRECRDSDLRERYRALRLSAGDAALSEPSAVEAIAIASEGSRRVLGMEPFDVQVVGAVAMIQGKLIEMQTGEGKTLVAVLAAAALALSSRGIHILTFNDYLARRDAEWMGPLYQLLGLRVACIQGHMKAEQRRASYAADITYLTAKEAGFDYLRDGLCYEANQVVHRPFHVAIVDEADSIMIDEARIPLVIAGRTSRTAVDARPTAELVQRLLPGRDFEVDAQRHTAFLTETGLAKAEASLGVQNLHASEHEETLTAVNLALHAGAVLRRDVDYIVRNDRVELVDELTGRVVHDRHWPDGLQAAVEAKEGLSQQNEGSVLGSITLQHFLGLYPRLAGMTATARPEEREFEERYGLRVVPIPPHKPCIRRDLPDKLFSHRTAKVDALVREIGEVHRTGRPILVGTGSVEESEALTQRLKAVGLNCSVLNAKNDELEAQIIAGAGALGAITISTNMAGRGTDIKLGDATGIDAERCRKLGGLLVIGTNRHESRRIDMQLRGRAGRQGDPGDACFFVCLEDDLMQRYRIDQLLPERCRIQRQRPIEDPLAHHRVSWAQRVVEGQNFDIRQSLWDYSAFIDQQRSVIRQYREQTLCGQFDDGLADPPEAQQNLRSRFGEAAADRVESRVRLSCIDKLWAEYLAHIAEVREGIQLVHLAGQNPAQEFRKRADAAFTDLLERIEDATQETLCKLADADGGVNLSDPVLKGPAATWTYLVDENPIEKSLRSFLTGHSIDLSIGAAILGPIYIAGALFNRYFKDRRSE